MNILNELLVLESADFVSKYSVLYDQLPERRVTAAKSALADLEKGVAEKKIFNADFGEAKGTLSRCLEDSLKFYHDKLYRDEKNWDSSPHMKVYQANIQTYVFLNTAKGQVKKIKAFLAQNPSFPEADKKLLTKMMEVNEAGEAIHGILAQLKPHIVKGRKPNQNVDPNAFHSQMGSAQAQKLVRKHLQDGIKKPLDEYEKAVEHMFQEAIDDLASRSTLKVNKHISDPITSMVFGRCFDFKSDHNWPEVTYTDIKANERAAGFAKKEAAVQRAMIEERYLAKNLKKLSHVVDLKGNLTKIEELPYKKPEVRSGVGTIESGFHFTFDDGSSFKVINKIVNKYSYTGKPFQQFPTTFHDVIFPDGTKMKTPSEEKIVKEFGAKK